MPGRGGHSGAPDPGDPAASLPPGPAPLVPGVPPGSSGAGSETVALSSPRTVLPTHSALQTAAGLWNAGRPDLRPEAGKVLSVRARGQRLEPLLPSRSSSCLPRDALLFHQLLETCLSASICCVDRQSSGAAFRLLHSGSVQSPTLPLRDESVEGAVEIRVSDTGEDQGDVSGWYSQPKLFTPSHGKVTRAHSV